MVFSLGDWHYQYLEKLERDISNTAMLKNTYEIRNSNRSRLYLPYLKGIKRKEVLSDPDMLLLGKRDGAPEYIIELEYNVNYKKLVGIALLTDMAIGKMQAKSKPRLILLTRQRFPNCEFIEKEIRQYVKNIEFSQFIADDFSPSMLT